MEMQAMEGNGMKGATSKGQIVGQKGRTQEVHVGH